MKIAVLDFNTCEVDIITVSEDWMRNDMRQDLAEQYEDEEWDNMDETELIDLFLYEYCNYDSSTVHMCEVNKVNQLTPKDFR